MKKTVVELQARIIIGAGRPRSEAEHSATVIQLQHGKIKPTDARMQCNSSQTRLDCELR